MGSISVEVIYQEEINDRERRLRFDDDIMGGLKLFHKLADLECAVIKMEVKTFGRGVHVTNNRMG